MEQGGGGERTERATSKKRSDARKEGQVRKSTEIVTAFSMLTMFAALSLFAPSMWNGMLGLMQTSLSSGWYSQELVAANMPRMLLDILQQLALIALPLLVVAMFAGVVFNVVQFGFMFTTKSLTPKFSKLNPLKGLKRMISLRTLFELAKSIAKIVVVGVIAYNKYITYMDSYAMMANQENLLTAFIEIGRMILDVGFTVAGALLLIGAMDFAYQWFRYEKDLKMTKYEVKMEYKQQEGDPLIKGKIKQKQRQMAMMRMMQSVPDADVVITNPTHYAVALKYDESVSAAPVITAKGQDYIAQKIKELARENNVEIVENKEVARSLYELCDVGSEVPFALFQAVAEILAFVFKKKNPR